MIYFFIHVGFESPMLFFFSSLLTVLEAFREKKLWKIVWQGSICAMGAVRSSLVL